MKGLFITFEGIEGCGKSTQSKLLKEYFETHGRDVLFTREPGGPKISEKIRNILLDNENDEMLSETEMLLYMAARCQHTGEWIIPALKDNKVVISDRYYDSTIAYQGAARQLDYTIIDMIRIYATFGLKPAKTILIDLPAEIGLGRIKPDEADRLESESMEFHRKVRNGFLEIAKNEPDRYIVVDGTQSIEEIHNEIIDKIKAYIKEGENETEQS